MTQIYALIAIGTAATLMAIILLLLRTKVQGRQPAVALAQQWAATRLRTSTVVVAGLAAIAAFSFSELPANDPSLAAGPSALSAVANAPANAVNATPADASTSDPQALAALRAYADNIGDKPSPPQAATPPAANTTALPDVASMLEKLIARLEKQPDDVNGWKTLGWSYLNTGNPTDAVKAYETALKLKPADVEIQKGLEQARSAQTLASRAASSDPAPQPTAQDIKAAADLSETQRDSMIRGMVDKLATRLETSPNDEDGWLRLMRSRMTLGEKDAAKAALAKALETFSSDAAAKARLTSAASELGVNSN
ncbi:MAG: tetratricopeptide repeat protein [Hyphomicrobium sp.]|nr:tetratricopeptide repeat protein [Hyphomicrobium sp.]